MHLNQVLERLRHFIFIVVFVENLQKLNLERMQLARYDHTMQRWAQINPRQVFDRINSYQLVLTTHSSQSDCQSACTNHFLLYQLRNRLVFLTNAWLLILLVFINCFAVLYLIRDTFNLFTRLFCFLSINSHISIKNFIFVPFFFK